MPNKDIFCNSPWFEFHIYWDGSLGYCCGQNPHHPYSESESEKYNIKNISIKEFYNSEPMRNARLSFNTNEKNPHCDFCWYVEDTNHSSKRFKNNQKSVIFQIENFKESYDQSPHNFLFESAFENDGKLEEYPKEFHIDLGNHCNLACKICWAGASSKIAAQENKWGTLENRKLLNNNWTQDSLVWNKFLNELISIPNIKNIHFMGGETLLSSRLKELIDAFDKHKKYDVCFSFVTNGTIFDEDLIEKLNKFKRVGIEISIETNSPHNEYIRQGSDNNLIFQNIQKFIEKCNNTTTTVTLRPAVGALSIGNYYTLIDWCLTNKILLKSNPIVKPKYLMTPVLPKNIRKMYINNYEKLIEKFNLNDIMLNDDFNESDINNYKKVALKEIRKSINELKQVDLFDQQNLLGDMISHLKKWDNIYDLNARDFYPELDSVFDNYGY